MSDTGNSTSGFRSVVAGVIVLSALVTGCESYDYRMSVGEFNQLQQRVREYAAPEMDDEAIREVERMLDRQLGPYRLGPGDVLSVNITGIEAASTIGPIPARVDRDGNVDLPTVNIVKIGGLELEDAERAIKAAYVPNVFRDAAVYVALTEPHGTRVVVTGSVAAPSVVGLPRMDRNLLFAINTAGGLTELASGKVTLKRIRRPTEEIVLDITEPHGLAAALALDPLEDGDLVRVHSAMPNTVFVSGLVNAPSPQSYPPGAEISVLQALAASGGLRADLFPRDATLVRRMPDGSDAHVKLDLAAIRCGEDPNLILAAGDVLTVPHTLETRVMEWVNRNIFLRAGVVMTYTIDGFEDLHSRFDSRGPANLEDRFDPFAFLTP